MNELKHVAEFRSILKDYKLSPSAQETLRQTKLAVLVGPTSSGRNTIVDKLVETGNYHHIVSDTTRELRVKNGIPVEQDGREYWFRDEEEVLADLRKGEYMEAAIIHNQQVSGCNIRELKTAQNERKIATKDIEPNGAHFVHDNKPDAVILFVVPPDLDAWMTRLHGRSDLPEDEIRRRLESACREMHMALEHDYYRFVVNDKLEDAVTDADDIARLGKVDQDKQVQARKVTEQLYQGAQQYLQQTVQ